MLSKEIKKKLKEKVEIIEKVFNESGYQKNEKMFEDYKEGKVATVEFTSTYNTNKTIMFDYLRLRTAFSRNVIKAEVEYILNSIIEQLALSDIKGETK